MHKVKFLVYGQDFKFLVFKNLCLSLLGCGVGGNVGASPGNVVVRVHL